ncbi:hypothetical protein BDN70DRAFT_43106 [Pholiota conissans]|uniref:Uncharacterized protein n=1 Tax=Pholiota conissans TaxID=109636 RepID=A0A9P6D0B3_9AGAR|nr:hypothetical protein BDN70DRAFT_43106 [Pholiota conissans]
MSRSIIVDDNDVGAIAYTGPWVSVYGSPSVAAGKPFYSNTLHNINSNGSFTYTFRGSAILVAGYASPQAQWNCTVDGQQAPQSVLPSALCFDDAFSPETLHTLSFTVDTQPEHPISFDYIDYFPTDTSAFDNATVFIGPSDPEIQYGGDWEQGQSGLSTVGPNSNLTILFTGVSLAWSSAQAQGNATSTNPNANATYSIDDQKPVAFDFSPSNDTSPRILFETPQLTSGQHKLTVVYQTFSVNSTERPIPLSLSGLIVQNATAPSAPTSPTLPPSSTSQAASPESVVPTGSSTNTSNGRKFTPIAGGVIGGLVSFAALLLILAAFIFYRRRRRNKKAKEAMTMLRASASLMPVSESKTRGPRAGHYAKSTDNINKPLSPTPSDHTSSSFPLSYTSHSEYHAKPLPAASGYWEKISFGRRSTRANSMAASPSRGVPLADNGLLKRPENPHLSQRYFTPAHPGLPANPAVYREAHRLALQKLLGIGTSTGSSEVPPLPEKRAPTSASLEKRGQDVVPPKSGSYAAYEKSNED